MIKPLTQGKSLYYCNHSQQIFSESCDPGVITKPVSAVLDFANFFRIVNLGSIVPIGAKNGLDVFPKL